MSVMLALLWKEGRENAYKVLIGFGACLVLLLLRQHQGFEDYFYMGRGFWALAAGIVGVVVMAMDPVAGERGQGTLAFILGQPVSAPRLLLAKFLAGAAGLGLVLAAYWLVTYASPFDPSDSLSPYARPSALVLQAQLLLADVGYVTIVYLWFTLLLMPYAAIFLGSALTDTPAKAIVLGAFLTVGAWLALTFTGSRIPLVAFHLGHTLHAIVWLSGDYPDGVSTVRLAREPGLLLLRAGIAVSVCGGLYGFGVWGLRRLRGAAIRWRTLAICWALLLGGWYVAADSLKPKPDLVAPTGSLLLDAGPVPVDFVVGDGMACLALRSGLSLVDLSDPTVPQEIGRIEVPEWKMSHVATMGSLAYALGRVKGRPTDSTGVAVFDISNPSAPAYQGCRIIGPVQGNEAEADLALADGGLCTVSGNQSNVSLCTFELDAHGLPGPPTVLELEASSERETIRGGFPSDRVRLQMHVVGQHVLISMPSGLSIVDVARISEPTEVNHLVLEEARPATYQRTSEVDGDRMYVQRLWPRELAVLDLADPARPAEMGVVYSMVGLERATVSEGFRYQYRYRLYNDGLGRSRTERWIAVDRLHATGLVEPVGGFGGTEERPGPGGSMRDKAATKLVVEDDHLYALWDGELVVWPLLK